MNRRRIVLSIGVIVVVISLLFVSISLLRVFTPPANTWAFEMTQVDVMQNLGFYGSGVVVGIVDTGVETSHQDFESSSFIGWNDTLNGELFCYDDCDHGTHIAGVLAGRGSTQGVITQVAVQGICPDAEFIVVKVISCNECMYGGGNDSVIASGIQYCVDHGADIICLSLGKKPERILSNENRLTRDACVRAAQAGVFVVAPAGNDRPYDDGDVSFVSRTGSVIAVGAVDSAGVIASFSSVGHQYPSLQDPDKKPEVVAPGVDLVSTRCAGSYGSMSGTAQSAAVVSGVLALLLDAYPGFRHTGSQNHGEETVELFKDVLAKTAKKIGNLEGLTNGYSHDDSYGYGLIQAFSMYEELGNYYFV
ncbi:MAG: S8 family serine peptidase [Methanobacteriota archaeon]